MAIKAKDLKINAPNIKDLVSDNPPITEGATAPINDTRNGMSDLVKQTQETLNEIEKDLGDGGNYVQNIIKNMHVVVGAATNLTPQGRIDPVGRKIPAAIAVSSKGTLVIDKGSPTIQEVDNHSMFPCGNYNIDVGNRFSVKTGGGGAHLVSSGSASLIGETTTKVSGAQTVVLGEDVTISGNSNVSIVGDTLNLKSARQVVVDGTLGVKNNIVVRGGMYTEGETFINHITAPREIQQTIIGFTKEGAEGVLKFGSWISGIAVIGGPSASLLGSTATTSAIKKLGAEDPLTPVGGGITQYPYVADFVDGTGVTLIPLPSVKIAPIKIYLGNQGPNNKAVELLPHGHEFPNLPLTLLESDNNVSVNEVLRNKAQITNDNKPAAASQLEDGPKYKKTSSFLKTFLIGLFNFPGLSKGFSITGK